MEAPSWVCPRVHVRVWLCVRVPAISQFPLSPTAMQALTLAVVVCAAVAALGAVPADQVRAGIAPLRNFIQILRCTPDYLPARLEPGAANQAVLWIPDV